MGDLYLERIVSQFKESDLNELGIQELILYQSPGFSPRVTVKFINGGNQIINDTPNIHTYINELKGKVQCII